MDTLEVWLYRTSFDQVDFNKMGQRLQIKGPGLPKKNSRGTAKKRSWDHKVTYSTINKMGIVLKALRDHWQDSYRPKRLQQEAMRLQIHGPGLQVTVGRGKMRH